MVQVHNGASLAAVGADRRLWLNHYPDGVDWNMPLNGHSVYDMFQEAANRFADRICTHFLGRQTSYSQIARQVERAAAGLQTMGVKKGSKVGLFLPNTPTFIVYYFATLKLGGVIVNYNPLYTVEELTFQVQDSNTEIMVTLDLVALFEKVDALMQADVLKRTIVCSFAALLPPVKTVLFKLLKGSQIADVARSAARDRITLASELTDTGAQVANAVINPAEDLAVLQYTGGTTGRPKGAMLTHANLTINVQQAMAWSPTLELGSEKMLALLPFFHVFAMTGVMNTGLAIGCELVLMPRFDLNEALKLITKQKPTIMPGVPTVFNALMNHPNIKSHDMTSLKLCLSGGAPLPLEVKRGFEAITGCSLVEAYGLSETSPGVTVNPLEGPVKEGSIGQPLPGTIVSLRSLDDPVLEVAQGERGEICIAGPQVMKGYWKRPEETANAFVGEFLRTGDVGIMDVEGFIFIVDRIKDLIICSGYNVYPRNVEEAIYQHPAVEECIVIGIPDDYRGEAPKAFIKVVGGQSVSVDDIFAHLEPKLSKIEMPSEIEFRDELPKTIIGKLSKKELKEEEAAKRAG